MFRLFSFFSYIIRKVPGKERSLHHLLEFVIIQQVSGGSLATPAQDSRPEGAGRNGLSPPPSSQPESVIPAGMLYERDESFSL